MDACIVRIKLLPYVMVAFMLNAHGAESTKKHNTFFTSCGNFQKQLDFKELCVQNDIEAIKQLFTDEKFACQQQTIYCLFNFGSPEAKKAASAVYPYAVWDMCLNDKSLPSTLEIEFIRESTKNGFIIPFICRNTSFSHFTTLQWLVSCWIKTVPKVAIDHDNPNDPEYDIILFLLKSGANPHYQYKYPSLKKQDAYQLIRDPETSTKGAVIKKLLDEFARGPINTTDMFYPGTPGYDEKRASMGYHKAL